ncbi:MAG: zinc-ribbon domain containing protein [Saccharofermentanales bacterium]
MSDKKIYCKDCGARFNLTKGEQKFINDKGLAKEPDRCPDCRRARNLVRNSSKYIFLMNSSERQNTVGNQ